MTLQISRPLRIARNLILVAILLLLLALAAAWIAMRMSLPALAGDRSLAGVKSAVSVSRDTRGTVTIAAADMADAVRALGFVHGQERFFEMDLTRRSAAGELSALLGPVTLPMDRDKRRHRLRARMTAQWQKLTAAERTTLSAYTEGVNAGLGALAVRPWQYLLLRTGADPWREVDSLLVISEMYFMLQARGFDDRFEDIMLRQRVGDRLFDWLKPMGGEWDAALDGSSVVPAAMPAAAELDTRSAGAPAPVAAVAQATPGDDLAAGSNNWAVGGALTGHGGAMLANDMHLGLGVPNIWFRTQITIGTGADAQRLAGVTLPGLPALVVGSNGHIAWGFTNNYGQWFDWVALPKSAAGGGPAIAAVRESITVKGGENVEIEVRESAYGPILRSDAATDYALSWVLYRDGGVNLQASDMLQARNVDDAIAVAQRSGMPHQNVLIADRQGNLAWTVMGKIPSSEAAPRRSTRGRLTAAAEVPLKWLATSDYPLVRNPPDGRLWTANSRQLGPDAGRGGDVIGDGGFDLGARAMQIRDRLREQKLFDEKGLHAIHFDSESRFIRRWATLAQSTARTSGDDKARAIDTELTRWNGRADPDQTGHRIVRAFRQQVMDQLWKAWRGAADRSGKTTDAAGKDKGFSFEGKFEYPAWQALSARPVHLLPMPYRSWDQFLVAQLAAVHDDLVKQHGSLQQATWGQRNISRIKHPFSRAMPFLSSLLDMPAAALAGDNNMPLVAAPTFGASERMVVAPGHEEQAILTMPGGQSGHPLSPFYGAGHDDWLKGRPTPLLAGAPQHQLRLVPSPQ